jgi:hypothetical protein
MRIVIAAFAATLAVFLWGTISWLVLPLHDMQFKSFTNQSAVSGAIVEGAASATASGTAMYRVPGTHRADGSEVSREGWEQAFNRGPFVLAMVRTGAAPWSIGQRMAGSLLIQFIGTLTLAWILKHCPKQTYWGRVGVCAAAGFFAGVVAWLPAWNWWDFPLGYCLVNGADLLIGGLAAGLVLARVIRPHITPHSQF